MKDARPSTPQRPQKTQVEIERPLVFGQHEVIQQRKRGEAQEQRECQRQMRPQLPAVVTHRFLGIGWRQRLHTANEFPVTFMHVLDHDGNHLIPMLQAAFLSRLKLMTRVEHQAEAARRKIHHMGQEPPASPHENPLTLFQRKPPTASLISFKFREDHGSTLQQQLPQEDGPVRDHPRDVTLASKAYTLFNVGTGTMLHSMGETPQL